MAKAKLDGVTSFTEDLGTKLEEPAAAGIVGEPLPAFEPIYDELIAKARRGAASSPRREGVPSGDFKVEFVLHVSACLRAIVMCNAVWMEAKVETWTEAKVEF